MPSTVGIVASAVWTPLDLAPALWLDASDPATITASGGAVSQWADKSGHDRHVTQATAAYQPATGAATWNGRNVLSFAGDWLVAADNQEWKFLHDGTEWVALAVVAVGESANPNDVYAIFGTHGGSSAYVGISFAYDDRGSLGRNDAMNINITTGVSGELAVFNSQSDTLPATQPVVARIELKPLEAVESRYKAYVGGVDTGALNDRSISVNSSSFPRYPLGIGALGSNGSAPLTGQIAEIIIVPRALTAAETTTAENYLAAKWGI